MPAFEGVHHVNLTVTDLERSAQWYVAVLGLTRGWDMDDVQGRGRKVVLLHPASSLRIVLTLHQSNEGEAFSEFTTGLDHLAFTVADRAELDAWVASFRTQGVACSAVVEGATGWLVSFRDPDNIQYEMYTRTK